ncbi:MAG TPA: sulfotransferase family protein [Verrucomicrobia bacterium]|nr:sulfotransferase family protein [Verrucomicrobiota bacterium]HOP96402.1 sulfotransferase family 2 domain-containing protein [Verrucomicrobiota bacterium]HPU57348.1 sulfotransferase family 2 domain-containing protein [Verrucomicrobiota bacterium]
MFATDTANVFVFLHIPKTGGSSFRFILENSFGAAHCHTNHTRKPVFSKSDLAFVMRFFPRLRSIAGHNLVDPPGLEAPDPFYMTFLREPVSRVISHYQDSVLRGNNRLSFEESLMKIGTMENLAVKLMAGSRDLEKAKRFLAQCGFVGLTEKFDLSLHVLRRLSPYRLNLNYRRKVVARDYRIRDAILADDRLIRLARERNQLDLELYEYGIKEVFPRLCRKAGLDPDAPAESFDRYRHELKPRYLLNRLYNQVFRQVYRRRNRTAG